MYKKHKKISMVALLVSLCMLLGFAWPAQAADFDNQVQFRAAYSHLTASRGNEIFTDTLSAFGGNTDRDGFSLATALSLKMHDLEEFMDAMLLGEIFMEYNQFSRKPVVSVAPVLAGTPPLSKVTVSQLNIAVSPKLRFDGLGMVRPFVAPVGLAFIVNSPPSNDTTYLDVGFHSAFGLDVALLEWLSVGWDFRYTHGLQRSDTATRNFSTGLFAGINF